MGFRSRPVGAVPARGHDVSGTRPYGVQRAGNPAYNPVARNVHGGFIMRVKAIVPAIGLATLLLASALPVEAVDISEVSGIVLDTDGNPVVGAEIRFTNTTNSALDFSAKSNKKGRYFIPNLLYNEPGEWDVIIEAEGYVPTNIAVESRKSDRTLVGEYETRIRPGTPHKVLIKAFGEARVDFTMITEEKVAELERQRQEEALQLLLTS